MLIKTILSWCVACFICTALPISSACAAAESKEQTPAEPGGVVGEPGERTFSVEGSEKPNPGTPVERSDPTGDGQSNSNTKRGPMQ
ncbi:MAG: hypothetical protein Q8R83_03470 [Legionellaceae bacterium]|nr:hypothetical protein [Legionellaceae bacterium]